MTRTIETLMAAARQESTPSGRTSDAGDALARVVAATRAAAEAAGLELRLARPAGSIRVRADSDVVERAVQPIVENAILYGKSFVAVELSSADSSVVITVSDDGPGVADDERHRIFEPGVRGHAGEQRVGDGAGLGLALAQRLARSCGGDITARASTTGGQFAVTLPAA